LRVQSSFSACLTDKRFAITLVCTVITPAPKTRMKELDRLGWRWCCCSCSRSCQRSVQFVYSRTARRTVPVRVRVEQCVVYSCGRRTACLLMPSLRRTSRRHWQAGALARMSRPSCATLLARYAFVSPFPCFISSHHSGAPLLCWYLLCRCLGLCNRIRYVKFHND